MEDRFFTLNRYSYATIECLHFIFFSCTTIFKLKLLTNKEINNYLKNSCSQERITILKHRKRNQLKLITLRR